MEKQLVQNTIFELEKWIVLQGLKFYFNGVDLEVTRCSWNNIAIKRLLEVVEKLDLSFIIKSDTMIIIY